MKKEQYSSKVFINAERRLFYLFQRDTMKKIIRLENVVVAAFARNSQTPHLTLEELKQVYDTVKVKDSASMQSKAAELFPGRDPISYENICVSKGPGRAFKHGGDEYVNPKCIINAHPLIVGVMDDGTFYQF